MSEESHSTARRVVLVALPVALLLAVAWWSLAPRPAPPAAPGAGSNAGSNATAAPASTTSPPPLAVDEMLRTLSAAPRLNQTSLAGLREALRALPPTEASQRIREFLTTTNDTPTGLEFKLGSDGRLSGAPTLRTFLLEQLDQLDPAGAAAFAQTLLQNPTSPDEWALALRSLARAETDPDARRMAAEKLQTMLTREAWQRQPSIGFLEAFDVAVHLRDPALVPTLTQLVQLKDNQAVAHAAYLALDRLTITAPASTLAALQAAPESMRGREVTRANYFARADVRDETQRALLENYLLQPHLGAEELAKFAGLYPNANYMVSHNLLTKSETPDHAWLVGRDREALQRVEAWLQDERFTRLQPQLREIERRLRQFVPNQRAAGP